MNETLFEASVDLTREDYREWVDLNGKKRKAGGIFLLVVTVLMLIFNLILAMAGETGWFVVILIFIYGGLLLFRREITLAAVMKSVKKRNYDTKSEIAFSDTGFRAVTEVGEETLDYRIFDCAVESDNLFALYLDKQRAVLLPKRALKNETPEAFRSFIADKTGKPVKKYRKGLSLGLRAALFGGTMLVVLFFQCIFPLMRASSPAEYSIAELSLTVDSSLELTYIDETEMDLEGEDAGVYVMKKLAAETVSGIEAFADWWTDGDGLSVLSRVTGEDGRITLTDTYAETFYYEVIIPVGEDYWVVQFCCNEEDQDAFEATFARWAESITIDSELL